MANTYTQIHVHVVFAVKFRNGLIQKNWKDDLYKYITGIVQLNNHKMIIINGVSDHVHALVGVRPDQSLSELVQRVKAGSGKWINDNKLTGSRFEWQEGFGAFAYSKTGLRNVIPYIENQEVHHQKKTFREEYIQMLDYYGIDYNEKYIFKDPI